MSGSQAVIPGIKQLLKPVDKCANETLDTLVNYYNDDDEIVAKRVEDSTEVANKFYNLVTDFYEFGWGYGFHLCPMSASRSLEHSMAKHEYGLALKLGLKPGMEVIDLGCGIGIPQRNIALLSGATITGINVNKYQVERCEFHTKNAGLEHLCKHIWGDFNYLSFPENSFDAAYAVEATCHSRDRKVYGEIYKVLKPGAKFAMYEWIKTEKFDGKNENHHRIINGIMRGNGVAELQTPKEVLASLRKVGFKILEAEDVGIYGDLPWYSSMQGRWTFKDFKSTPVGMVLVNGILWVMECARLVPQGSYNVSSLLISGAKNLIRGGEEGIFSPAYMVVAEKPAE